ncbi:10011_t:CDS:2, partial [Rhizophagus irregularis]
DNKDDDGSNSDNEEIEYEEMEEEIIDETELICRSVGEEID